MNKTSRQFEGLLSRYFETLLENSPMFATISAGLRSGEGKLGSLSLQFQKTGSVPGSPHFAPGKYFTARTQQ